MYGCKVGLLICLQAKLQAAQPQGQKEVCREKSGMSSSQQVDALARKSGEGCKASTQPRGEEKTHLRTHSRPPRNAIK